jgi:shikimate dehydrogenase
VTSPRLFVLLGSPVDHSLSPALHEAAFRVLEADAVYAAVEAEAAEVEPVMRAVARRGGGNVTLPHKERAAEAVDRACRAVEATGACNCFWRTPDGDLAGDNTDVEGFLAAVSGLMPDPPTRPRGGGRARGIGIGSQWRCAVRASERFDSVPPCRRFDRGGGRR